LTATPDTHPDDFLGHEQILRIQDAKLAALGKRLAASDDWVDHFRKAGMHPLDLRDRESLAALPTLEKTDFRDRYPFPFLTVPMEKVQRFASTSGTTGLPVMFGFSKKDWQVTIPNQLGRIFRAVGVKPGDRVYQGYGYGLWLGGTTMDEALASYGAVNFPIGPGRGELVVQWLKDHAYEVTTMSPLWLMTLITLARKQGIDPKRDWKLRIGILGGQSVSATFRDEMEAQMPDGFVAHNVYGTTEGGGPVIAISCPHSHDSDELHLINEDSVMTEVLDPVTLKPVAPGEVGEIVLTTLDKEASPVLRWRTRDLTRLSARPYSCACGRSGYPLIGRIIGRSDDMVKIRGTMVFPSQIEDVITGIDGTVKEAWQVYVEKRSADGALNEIEIAFERAGVATSTDEQLTAEVKSRLKARLGVSCKVVCHPEGALPRYEAKAMRVIHR